MLKFNLQTQFTMSKKKQAANPFITSKELSALQLLETINERSEKYLKLNKELTALQGDFASQVHPIDVAVETKLIAFLDEVLGDELATYYLYETSLMKDGGAIYPKAKKHPKLVYRIKTIADLEVYLTDRKRTRNFTRNLKTVTNRKGNLTN